MDYDSFSSGKSVNAFNQSTINTATTTYGEWIDTLGARSLTVSLYLDFTAGNITGITWQESDLDSHTDAATMDDVKSLYQPGILPLSADGVVRVGCISKSRYVRIGLVSDGTANLTVRGMGELGHTFNSPLEVEESIFTLDDINIQGETGDAKVTAPKRS
jgi:hypothetical protein